MVTVCFLKSQPHAPLFCHSMATTTRGRHIKLRGREKEEKRGKLRLNPSPLLKLTHSPASARHRQLFLFRKACFSARGCVIVASFAKPIQEKFATQGTSRQTRTRYRLSDFSLLLIRRRVRARLVHTCCWLPLFSTQAHPSKPSPSSIKRSRSLNRDDQSQRRFTKGKMVAMSA